MECVRITKERIVHYFVTFRACLKSTVCRVRTAHQLLKAPDGRKVYRNTKTPCTSKPQRGIKEANSDCDRDPTGM